MSSKGKVGSTGSIPPWGLHVLHVSTIPFPHWSAHTGLGGSTVTGVVGTGTMLVSTSTELVPTVRVSLDVGRSVGPGSHVDVFVLLVEVVALDESLGKETSSPSDVGSLVRVSSSVPGDGSSVRPPQATSTNETLIAE